jgi:hypothetical protein
MTDPYDTRLSLEGTGEAVVLVPGLDGTGQLFYRQRPLLARNRKVATYALRDSAPTMSTLVADLAGVPGSRLHENLPRSARGVRLGFGELSSFFQRQTALLIGSAFALPA